MSKRPSLGPEAVVRKSRLATKGEAVPAMVHGRHGHEDHPAIPSAPVVVPVVAPAAVPVADPPEAVAEVEAAPPLPPVTVEEAPAPVSASVLVSTPASEPVVAQSVVDGLLASLAEKDRLLAEKDRLSDQLRADLLRLEQERLQERAAAAREQEQAAGNLAAADATVDELRNRVGDLKTQLDAARAEVSRLIEHHGAERQRLLEHHKAESERLLAAAAATRQAAAASPVVAALDSGLQSAKRWLFGDEAQPQPQPARPSTTVNQRPAPGGQQRPAAQPQKPTAGAPAAAKPSVVKPVGPPTAPKILNRRPVG